MRIAVLVLGLLLGSAAGCQSCAVYTASSIGDGFRQSSENPDQTSLQQSLADPHLSKTTVEGAAGLLVAFLMVVGGALVFASPVVSAVCFGLAALLAFPNASEFRDLRLWAVASVVLAVMALLSRRKKVPLQAGS